MESRSRALPAERCLAVLVDSQHLRLFLIQGERVDELRDRTNGGADGKHADGPPARAAADGLGAGRAGQRVPARAGHDDGAHACGAHSARLPVLGACDHVRRAADRVAHLVRAERVDRILAGGAPECVAELKRILRTRLGGDIEPLALPADSSARQVAAAARAACRAEATSREEEVLGSLIDAVGRGLAALGPAAVAEAVNDHRASLLVIPHAAGPSGFVCPACDAVFAAPPPAACPACGETPIPAADFLERLARLVREHGGEVEEIKGPAGEALRAYGGLAALLRYTFPGAGRACPWNDVAEDPAEPAHANPGRR